MAHPQSDVLEPNQDVKELEDFAPISLRELGSTVWPSFGDEGRSSVLQPQVASAAIELLQEATSQGHAAGSLPVTGMDIAPVLAALHHRGVLTRTAD